VEDHHSLVGGRLDHRSRVGRPCLLEGHLEEDHSQDQEDRRSLGLAVVLHSQVRQGLVVLHSLDQEGRRSLDRHPSRPC